jgi:hypothetical protein
MAMRANMRTGGKRRRRRKEEGEGKGGAEKFYSRENSWE